MICLHEFIGKEALLEQFAEECTEAAHAALKLSRILRGDNPTGAKSRIAAIADLVEELTDLDICIEELEALGIAVDEVSRRKKCKRMVERLIEKGSA